MIKKFLAELISITLVILIQGCSASKSVSYKRLDQSDHISKIITTDSIDVFITSENDVYTEKVNDTLLFYTVSPEYDEYLFLIEIPSIYIDQIIIDNGYNGIYSATPKGILEVILYILLNIAW